MYRIVLYCTVSTVRRGFCPQPGLQERGRAARSSHLTFRMAWSLGTYLLYIQAVVNDVFTPDLLVSVLVLIAVSLAATRGSATLAALCATAPTGVPLSMWLVYKAQRWDSRRWASTTGVGDI